MSDNYGIVIVGFSIRRYTTDLDIIYVYKLN